MPAGKLEAALQARVLRALRARGAVAAKLTAQGFTGWPDVAVALPKGRVLWVELKRLKRGRLSARQQYVHAQLAAMGHEVLVTTDYKHAITTICQALEAPPVPRRSGKIPDKPQRGGAAIGSRAGKIINRTGSV